MSKMHFDDGSSIEWVDKESLRYRKERCSALIWVDFEPGFFRRGRIVKASSLAGWESPTPGCSEPMDARTKQEILRKVLEYYRLQNVSCRVEE